tara:strand:+ start:217 stop:378 length:162 start_codon:yes stop_codon:yes gene_type:complete
MSSPTLVEGLVKGIGRLAPVLSDSQETPQARTDMAPSIIKNFLNIKEINTTSN